MAPIKVVISYSHKDEIFAQDLLGALSVLRRKKLIEIWHDRKLLPGTQFNEEIMDKFLKAQIFLLVISADFINSDYCMGKELSYALEARESGRAEVIPVIARSCYWDIEPLSSLTAIPTDRKAVSDWQGEGGRDRALKDIVIAVKDLAVSLRQKYAPPIVNLERILTKPLEHDVAQSSRSGVARPDILANIRDYLLMEFPSKAAPRIVSLSGRKVVYFTVNKKRRFAIWTKEQTNDFPREILLQSISNSATTLVEADDVFSSSNGVVWQHVIGKQLSLMSDSKFSFDQLLPYLKYLIEDRTGIGAMGND